MKNFLIFAAVVVFGYAAVAVAQNAPASNNQGMGRGGTPYARNDKNKDGICDLTGAPVGQGPCGAGMRRARGGRWAGGGGRGMGRGFRFQQQRQPQQAAPAPAQK